MVEAAVVVAVGVSPVVITAVAAALGVMATFLVVITGHGPHQR